MRFLHRLPAEVEAPLSHLYRSIAALGVDSEDRSRELESEIGYSY